MTHVGNIYSVFRQGAVLSKERVNQRQIVYQSIAEETVQDLRKRIFIRDLFTGDYRGLHSYVPFYFSTRPPMLYVNINSRGLWDQLVILEVNRYLLTTRGAVFTNGNASMQRLSRDFNEKVYIIPASTSTTCQRSYRPRSYGTSVLCSEFYADVAHLRLLDWGVIGLLPSSVSFDEDKRIRSAEALFPDQVLVKEIQCIAVPTSALAQQVKNIARSCHLEELGRRVVCKPDLFQT